MSTKRVTIYDIAKALNISASYVSKALGNHPSISEKMKALVKHKAEELNYKHNSHAANLRRGSSRTIGVIVPHINHSFFSEAIAGIEEVCAANDHSLIICQSHEKFENECKAVETLIHQNVDCVLISASAETNSIGHLQSIRNNNIELIQFDRYIDGIHTYKVLNDNEVTASEVTKRFIEQGYTKIAFMGGPAHLPVFKLRKEGYLKTLRKAGFSVQEELIFEDALSQKKANRIATDLLQSDNAPDAFFTVSDHQALGIWQAAKALHISMPDKLGIFGFANEDFTSIVEPALSSVDQKSKELGKEAANLYFQTILKKDRKIPDDFKEVIIKMEVISRMSTDKKNTIMI